jgi:homoserine O-acetyltransferase
MNERRELWWKYPTSDIARVLHLDLPDGFAVKRGGVLPSVQIGYESWGALNERKDNAVLIVHPLTADPHASGGFAGGPPGWWEPLIGPGRPIDTDRYYVVCPNLLGGCYGTTGPRFPAPDGAPYLGRFPLLTPADLMTAQRLFLKQLGIARLRMVIGPSMGGMVAWEWAIEAGDQVDLVAVVAAPLRTTAHEIGLNWIQRRGVELDLQEDRAIADWGQMVARGVGMLSYRSPVGLEEKFGRDWFQEPGVTLAERGMFNVESWLRHHGKRIARRFDPYTYILFTRAMDLHDVGDDRGGLIPALDRVRCRTLVVAVSSDTLYPPVEVHQGADILSHLGKPVEYAEIRSPHGHDAVFLETDQLGALFTDAFERPLRIVPTPGARAIRPVRIGVLGAGRVASLFARLLIERRTQIHEDYALDLSIRAVADIDPSKSPGPEFAGASFGSDPFALLGRNDIDVIVETTNGTTAGPLVETALRGRRSVVTPNKALVREHGSRLEALALECGVRLAYHNAIAAGWPLLYAVERPLGNVVVESIEAVLSCTAGVILERMEAGDSFERAVEHARSIGVTEFDPELDTSGWDSAQKLTVLLARAKGLRYAVSDMATEGMDRLDPRLPRAALSIGFRIRLVAMFEETPDGPVGGVFPVAVAAESHLGTAHGENNVVVLRSGEMGEMVYIGKGRGSLPVATAVLNDLIGLYHPSRSWTGRYPRAPRPLGRPRFRRYLCMTESGPAVTGEPAANAVPIHDPIRSEAEPL